MKARDQIRPRGGGAATTDGDGDEPALGGANECERRRQPDDASDVRVGHAGPAADENGRTAQRHAHGKGVCRDPPRDVAPSLSPELVALLSARHRRRASFAPPAEEPRAAADQADRHRRRGDREQSTPDAPCHSRAALPRLRVSRALERTEHPRDAVVEALLVLIRHLPPTGP